jgi:hypothetical protein
MDCFAEFIIGRRLAPARWLAITARYALSFPRRDAPELWIYFPPEEGVGNAGRPMHPQSGGQKRVEGHTSVVTTSIPETPDIPAHNGFNRLLRDLPGDRALLPPSPDGYGFV